MAAQKELYTTDDVHRWLEDGEPLDYTDFSGSKLIGLHLPKLSLKGASFREADLRYANLAGSNLEEADFTGALLAGIKLTGAVLRGAIFDNASLENSNLVRADLGGASLKSANLAFASLRAANVTNADFSQAKLQGVNFSGAEGCSSASFNGVDLSKARLRYTGLEMFDLLAKGAKPGGATGMDVNVFKNIKTSWVEFLPGWFGWLLAPFRFIKWIFVGIFRLLTLPFRLFRRGEGSSS